MKLTRTFTAGIMNKDLDERLIPKGQYRDGLNIGVSTSETSNVGSIENILGNTQVGGDLSFLSRNAVTIGAIADGAREQFYWMVTDTDFDYVLRYDEPSNTTAVLLKDTKGRVLNFNSEHIITGINLIENLLFWTDNLNQPRRLNVGSYYPTDGFTEDDISVIVKPPIYPPSIELNNTTGSIIPSKNLNIENNLAEKYIRFGYRWRYENNEFSALSPFSATAFGATIFSYNYSEGVFTSMENGFNEVVLSFFTGETQVTDVQLVMFNEFTGSVYIIETLNKEDNNWLNNSEQTFSFNNSKIYSILSVDEVSRLFDNVPRKAKAQEIIGSRLIYGNYIQGYDIIDSAFGNEIPIDFFVEPYSVPISNASRSFHSDRDYEVGIVYLDEYGRMSTVLTPTVTNYQFSNTTYISPEASDKMNDLRISINHRPPAFAYHYRIYLKQSKSNQYNTIFPFLQYRDGNDFFFRIQRADVNKLNVGDFIYLKNINGLATNVNKQFRVLEIEEKEDDFLNGGEIGGTYFKLTDDGNFLEVTVENITTAKCEGGIYLATGANEGKTYIDQITQLPGTNGNCEMVAQIDFPHHYGVSNTHTWLQLLNGPSGGTSPNATAADRDFRIKVTITPNETFKIESFVDGQFETWYEDVDLSLYYNNPYYLNGTPTGFGGTTATGLGIYMRFSNGPGYNVNDYFIINIHSAKGNTVFGMSTEPPGGQNGVVSNPVPAGDVCSGISPITFSGETTPIPLSLTTGNTNPDPNLRDVSISAGAVITISIKERFFEGQGLTNKLTSENEFVSSSNYANIEEWFYEDKIYQSLSHLNAQDSSLDNNGERIFFRRVQAFKAAKKSILSPANIYQSIGFQALSSGVNGAPYLNSQGNWSDYAVQLAFSQPIQMFVRGSSIIKQVNRNGNNTQPASQGAGHVDLKTIDVDCFFSITQATEGNPIFESKPIDRDDDIFYETPFTFNIDRAQNIHLANVSNQSLSLGGSPAIVSLNTSTLPSSTLNQQQNAEFNCWSFGNGVEATRIKGIDNEPWLRYSPRASGSIEDYGEEHLSSSLTYSGVFVENTNINNLNEFNLSLGNYKDLSREYGPIQKLHTRNNDIVTLQEDKVSKILFGKNLLSDSTGGGAVASIPEVLGTQIPYVGEYGISHNPESFASWGSNMFFADAKRGAVLRLGQDGIFEISNLGMSDYFKDLFRDNFNTQKLGVIDPFKEQYVISNTNTIAPGCIFSFTPYFVPQFGYQGASVQLQITSNQNWVINLIDTGSGIGWATINGQNPSYASSGNQLVTIDISAQGLGSSDRQLDFEIVGCNGTTVQTFTQSGKPELSAVVWGVGAATDGLNQGDASIEFDFTSNPSGPIEFINQPIGEKSPLFVQRKTTGIEGSSAVPKDGDTVTLKATQLGAVRRKTFAPLMGTKMYYLVSDVEYSQTQINDLLSNPATVNITPILVGTNWEGSFLFNRPLNEAFLYLIIDYRSQVDTGAGNLFEIPSDTNNTPGKFTGLVNFNNKKGRVSFPYTPDPVGGAIYTIKEGDSVIATTGSTPVLVPGTLDFLKQPISSDIYNVEIDYFGTGGAIRLETPDPTLTIFNIDVVPGSLNPADPNYVCPTPVPAATKYHDGTGLLPEEGSVLYENPSGTVVYGDGELHRYGTAVAPNTTWLRVTETGLVTELGECEPCAEVAVPVITIPSVITTSTTTSFDFNIEATNNPIDFRVIGACDNYQIVAGDEGASLTYVDCNGVSQDLVVPRASGTVVEASAIPVVSSGTATITNSGVSLNRFLPKGLNFERETGRLYGIPQEGGVFNLQFTAENCFGTSAVSTLSIQVVDVNNKTFLLDGSQFGLSSVDACALTETPTLFFHTGETVYPEINDTITIPIVGDGGVGGTSVFKGGYVWYKAPWDTGAGNGTVLLIDDRGVVIDKVEC